MMTWQAVLFYMAAAVNVVWATIHLFQGDCSTSIILIGGAGAWFSIGCQWLVPAQPSRPTERSWEDDEWETPNDVDEDDWDIW